MDMFGLVPDININIVECKCKSKRTVDTAADYININIVECK